ncbi:MAG: CRTAC1 family protein [Gammaproteobacteria bacterium]|nr:CRTAC1 family protein [Gammaproteobacteria bacterium]
MLMPLAGCQSELDSNQGDSVAGGLDTPEQTAEQHRPLFVDVTQSAGLAFAHENGGSGRFYMPEIMGAGAALLDIDDDGDLDLYLVQGGPIDGNLPSASDRLYRNDSDVKVGGELKFTDITDSAGIPTGGYGMGVATGDVDGDGHLDLYVTNFGPNRLLKNQGDGTFTDISESAAVGDDRWSVPAAFFDLEGYGDLDLYVGSYVDFRLQNHRDCFSGTGLADFCSPHSYSAVTDRVFRNRGNGVFEDVSANSGIRSVRSKALGVITADFDADGQTDLYVANDGVANQLWLNQGDGRFAESALLAGCALNYEGLPEASMGVDAADVDNDGDEDLFMTHLRGETNTLYVNDGSGNFEDRTIRLGLAGPSIPFTGFGTAWLDVENDGKLDLLTVNGAVTVEERLVQQGDAFPYHQPNQLFRNVGSATQFKFQEYQSENNNPLAASHVSRGAAFGDLDNDGDLDVVITNNSGPARILQNVVGQDNAWLGLRVLLNDNGTDALGAAVTLQLSDGSRLFRRVRTSGSYVSANDPRLLYGLGNLDEDIRVAAVVEWVGGQRELFGPLPLRRYSDIIRGQGRPATLTD